jgi:hypothetical protein
MTNETEFPSEKAGLHAERGEFLQALKGLDFPASKSGALRRAQDNGGLDREVPHVLSQIQDRTYESLDDLMEEVERIYAAGGNIPLGGPAAENPRL